MKRLVIGILAHVDAGKTTLVESMLYNSGNIKTLGRVDHKNAFLDTYELERDRGITIYSKQAILKGEDSEITLLDTPGHVDFSSEMERTLQVLDYAILVISGRDGVQGHTETLWKLLEEYNIPTFIFINKMDMPDTDKNTLLEEVRDRLSDNIVDFTDNQKSEEFFEHLAMCDEQLLDKYIENEVLNKPDIVKSIKNRNVFPCFFGSALKLSGIDTFVKGLREYTSNPICPKKFGARVYKIARDADGNRLTFMKITGGTLKVKMSLRDNKNTWEEKVNQIRIYSGNKYELVDEVNAGSMCVVAGLTSTFPGEGLGRETTDNKPFLEPVLNYQVILPEDCNVHEMLINLRQIEEEEPQLRVVWNEKLKEIHVKLMGEIQVEILKEVILDRFDIEVEFDKGSIVYKETIGEKVVGVGHYEPLTHYAEVHLALEPGKPGSGITYASDCSEDVLDSNWQRLVLSHLKEKEHIGVLTGSPLTDVKITLIAGRADLDHTSGGDFRQATYRAVRQGLMKAKSVLLEPYYNFRMDIPSDNLGRAMTDIQQKSGKFFPPKIVNDRAVLTGYVPVSTLGDYQSQLNSYTSGSGRMMLTLKGYEPCHNSNEVIASIGYDPESDFNNQSSSIFCSRGAGFSVKWDQVEDYMHIRDGWEDKSGEETKNDNHIIHDSANRSSKPSKPRLYKGTLEEDKELESIFERTYGSVERKLQSSKNVLGYEKKAKSSNKDEYNKWKYKKKEKSKERYLLVDGYNIIFAWDELEELANKNIASARTKLADILSNYQGYKKSTIILVFDAYKVEGGLGSVIDYSNISIVFTKEAETADMYIEKVTNEIGHKHNVVVATSDRVEQMIIMGQGATRLSAKELKEEINLVKEEMRTYYKDKKSTKINTLDHILDEEFIELDSEEK